MLKARKGAIAFCSAGRLGLITSERPMTIHFKGKEETVEAWTGVHLYDYPVMDEAGVVTGKVSSGDPWCSRTPTVVAYIDSVQGPYRDFEKTFRCPHCYTEMDTATAKQMMTCPYCGYFGSPQRIEFDTVFSLNWDEMRTICEFANQWAAEAKVSPEMSALFARIFGKIRLFRPPNAPALLNYEQAIEANMAEGRKTFADRAAKKVGGDMVM